MPTVTIYRTRFIEPDDPDLWGGPDYENDTDTEVIEVDDVDDAVRLIETLGLTFSATGNDWAADPDGSYISNYATAERVETSAHLNGFSDAEVETIMEWVG